MPYQCCVPHCKDKYSPRRRFPRIEKLMKTWVELTGNKNLLSLDPDRIYRGYRVCDIHFDESCRSIGFTTLKPGSVPSLHLDPVILRDWYERTDAPISSSDFSVSGSKQHFLLVNNADPVVSLYEEHAYAQTSQNVDTQRICPKFDVTKNNSSPAPQQHEVSYAESFMSSSVQEITPASSAFPAELLEFVVPSAQSFKSSDVKGISSEFHITKNNSSPAQQLELDPLAQSFIPSEFQEVSPESDIVKNSYSAQQLGLFPLADQYFTSSDIQEILPDSSIIKNNSSLVRPVFVSSTQSFLSSTDNQTKESDKISYPRKRLKLPMNIRNFESLVNKNKALATSNKKLKRRNNYLAKCLKDLRMRYKEITNKKEEDSHRKAALENMPPTLKTLFHSYLKNYGKKPKGRRYTNEEKLLATSLFKEGSKQYRIISNTFCLPVRSTVREALISNGS